MKRNERFKAWVVASDLTARQIATAVGLSKVTVNAYMQGIRSPSRIKEREMCEALNMPNGLFD